MRVGIRHILFLLVAGAIFPSRFVLASDPFDIQISVDRGPTNSVQRLLIDHGTGIFSLSADGIRELLLSGQVGPAGASGATGPQGPPGPLTNGIAFSMSGVFSNADLISGGVTGILTVVHNWHLSAPFVVSVSIFNSDGQQISAPVLGSTNTVQINLARAYPIMGIWGYKLVH